MTVYVLILGDKWWDDWYIEGVYSSKEAAAKKLVESEGTVIRDGYKDTTIGDIFVCDVDGESGHWLSDEVES